MKQFHTINGTVEPAQDLNQLLPAYQKAYELEEKSGPWDGNEVLKILDLDTYFIYFLTSLAEQEKKQKINPPNKLIGLFILHGDFSDSHQSESVDLCWLYVLPEFRSQGFGKELMQRMIHLLTNSPLASYKRILIEVRSENKRAQNLYESFGAKPLHERKNYYGPGQNALFLSLLLPSSL